MDGIYNAKITYTKLGFEDHGCLTLEEENVAQEK